MDDPFNFTVKKNIIEFLIPKNDILLIKENAEKASIGGVSRIRKNEDRQKSLSTDQLIGQICNYAASVVLTNSADGYIKAREIANANPFSGDKGVDIIGLPNIDVKGSLMRRSENPYDYRLLVRERERHEDWIYILALVPKGKISKCFLVGWAHDKDLPKKPYDGPIQALHGAYCIKAKDLNDISLLVKKLTHNIVK